MKDAEKIIERVVPIGLGTVAGGIIGKKVGAPKKGALVGAGIGAVYGSTLKYRREAEELAAENAKLRNELQLFYEEYDGEEYDGDSNVVTTETEDDSKSSSPSIFNGYSSEEEESTIDE